MSAAFAAHVKLLVPAKLPVAREYRSDTVHYEGQVVVHRGSAYQAVRYTARPPPNADWVCLASAGRDGVDGKTPNVRETYNVHEKYQRLDVVVVDGAPWIARRDNPGMCPGEGWQLMSKQGRRGRTGERGRPGEPGPTGPPATMPQIVNSKIDEYYNLTVLRSDNSLEIIPLRPAFERFFAETKDS
jgi:hypothetical protein